MLLSEPIHLYLNEIYSLGKMCYNLISSELIDEVYREYQFILKSKNIQHQFISTVMTGDYWLGCIDPKYRHGKPLKYLLDSRHMIFAMCDRISLSNIKYHQFPVLHEINSSNHINGLRLKKWRIELIPIEKAHRREVHYTFRQFIEFNIVDTYGPLRKHLSDLMLSTVGFPSINQPQIQNPLPIQQTPTQSHDNFLFNGFLNSLPQ